MYVVYAFFVEVLEKDSTRFSSFFLFSLVPFPKEFRIHPTLPISSYAESFTFKDVEDERRKTLISGSLSAGEVLEDKQQPPTKSAKQRRATIALAKSASCHTTRDHLSEHAFSNFQYIAADFQILLLDRYTTDKRNVQLVTTDKFGGIKNIVKNC